MSQRVTESVLIRKIIWDLGGTEWKRSGFELEAEGSGTVSKRGNDGGWVLTHSVCQKAGCGVRRKKEPRTISRFLAQANGWVELSLVKMIWAREEIG